MAGGLWHEKCVAHYDDEVIMFFERHFKEKHRKCLIIGGAGFDPRSTTIIQCLSEILGRRLAAYLIKEERPDPDTELINQADKNLLRIGAYCENLEVVNIDIFASDGAVVGGRNVIKSISNINFSQFSDIVIDMSALSMGVSYPIVSYIYKSTQGFDSDVNVHLALLSNPNLDAAISSDSNDKLSKVHGFDLNKLFGEGERALLWLPVLSENKEHLFKIIHAGISLMIHVPFFHFHRKILKRVTE